MKNIIEYYYNFISINITKKNNKMTFKYNNNDYKISETLRTDEELREIYTLLINNKKYNKIILTKNNTISIINNNKKYIIQEIKNNNGEIDIIDILSKTRIKNIENYKTIRRDNWYKLWTEKIDYINYQRTHIKGINQVLDQYIDYYIGLGENAISYLLEANNSKKDERDIPVVSHRRINSLKKEDYYDANNIILDHYVRDIAEYLKYLFFLNKINIQDVAKIIKNLNLSEYGFRLLFCRLLFPTYFFDMYEQIINNNIDEKIIVNIVNKASEFEMFLKFIYKEVNKKTRIPSINWISS